MAQSEPPHCWLEGNDMDANILRLNYLSDLVIKKGATFSKRLTLSLQASDGTLTPINLTGLTARMQVRKRSGSTVMIELTTANERIGLGGAAGTIDLTISATDTAALAAGIAAYDLELVDGAVVARVLQGAVDITPEITA